MKRNAEIERIMQERFGRDTLLCVATEQAHVPYARTVDALYEDGAFYVVTYALSRKMQQIKTNPTVGVCGEWFSAHGTADNIGHPCSEENQALAARLRAAFAAWYAEGDVDESDEHTCILRIRLTDGILFANGTRYDIDFTN